MKKIILITALIWILLTSTACANFEIFTSSCTFDGFLYTQKSPDQVAKRIEKIMTDSGYEVYVDAPDMWTRYIYLYKDIRNHRYLESQINLQYFGVGLIIVTIEFHADAQDLNYGIGIQRILKNLQKIGSLMR